MTIIDVKSVTFAYEQNIILKNISCSIPDKEVSAIYGSSGSGKTTFLMILSLLFRELGNYKVEGEIIFQDNNRSINLLELKNDYWRIRRKIAYIAQEPDPLSMSIYKNLAFPLKLMGVKEKKSVQERIESALCRVHLFNEIKDRLHDSALELSGGQKQRLCIARAIMMNPMVLLLDEPTSSLDNENKQRIESLLAELGREMAVLIVSHDLGQIKSVARNIFHCTDKQLLKKEKVDL